MGSVRVAFAITVAIWGMVAGAAEPAVVEIPAAAHAMPNAQAVAFSPDGRQLLVGGSGLTLFDRTTGEVIRRFDAD